MNTENVIKHLRTLWRTDRIIAELRMRHMLIGLGLRAFAALIAAFGLLMLELSAYFALVQVWSAISAAAILGAVNFAIAAILFLIAGRPPGGRELELATEIHGSSIDALQIEARALQSQVSGAFQPSAEQRPAAFDRSADHDHPQKPEEAGGQTRRRRREIAANVRFRWDRCPANEFRAQVSRRRDRVRGGRPSLRNRVAGTFPA